MKVEVSEVPSDIFEMKAITLTFETAYEVAYMKRAAYTSLPATGGGTAIRALLDDMYPDISMS